MPTHSVKAYDLYLKARSIDRSESQSEASITRQRELLDEAVREDPNFVEAWAVLKEVYDVSIESMGRMGWFVPEVGDSRSVCNDLLLKSVNALKKAVSLDAEKIETLIARASGVVGEEHLGSEIPADNSEIRRKVMDLTLQKYPDSAMAWYVLGWWYLLNANDVEAAKPVFIKALAHHPLRARIVGGFADYFPECRR